MFLEFKGRDVVGKIDHQSSIFVVGPCQIHGVGDPQRFLFNDVMDSFTREPLADVLCDLANELIRDDGDVLDACSTDGAQSVVNHGAFVEWKEGFLCVVGKWMKA